MTPADLRALKERLGLNNTELAKAIGITPKTCEKLCRDGQKIKRTVALACAALARSLPPWPG